MVTLRQKIMFIMERMIRGRCGEMQRYQSWTILVWNWAP